ncbi:MAG: serpin family protein [Gemmatimonadales bacterium]|jgi:serpin B
MDVKLRRWVAVPLAGCLIQLAAACGDGPTEPHGKIEGLPRPLDVSETAVVNANNRFGFDLLRQLNAADPDSNIFISPLSASMALGMTLNGAAGSTYDAMRATLGFGELSNEAINQSYRGLIDLLIDLDPRVTFGLGNSIWYREGFPVEQDFLDTTGEYFDAEVSALDFDDAAAADVINGWVETETAGKIEQIIDPPIDPQTVMFLINAIYFNGTWTYEFDKSETEQAPFHRSDGSTVPVMFMAQQTDLAYAHDEGYQAVDLPYGGEAYSMTVVLPREGVDIDSLIAELDADSWEALLADARVTGLELHLPRFRLEYEKVLNDALKALGMEVAFVDGAADFSRIAPGWQLFISQVKQKTFVKVDEEGTEAAAVTSVEVGYTSIPSGPPVLRVDRPFLFAIRERFSGTVIFVGKIVDLPPA